MKEQKEKGRVVKKRADSATSKSKSSTKKGSYAARLTSTQRREAREMFAEDNIPDEEKYKLYLEIEK